MEITKNVDVDIDIDPEDVLDEMSTKDIEEYLATRKNEEASPKELRDNSFNFIKNAIISICAIKRNKLLIDKTTAKQVMNELINDLF